MIVLTVDQRGSRKSEDKVEHLIENANSTVGPLRPFQRTAGDEVQGVLDHAGEAVHLAVMLAASGEWSVGVGFGEVELPLPKETRAGRGPAFEHARDAVERAKRAAGSIAVSSAHPETERLEAELQLTASIVAKRRSTSWEAGLLMDRGMTQSEVAKELGITQQAVSMRLASSLWFETNRMMLESAKALGKLIEPGEKS